MRTRTSAVLALVTIAATVSACGSGGSGGRATATPAAQESGDQAKRVAFTRCMRGKGIDMPDPKGNGSVGVTGGSASQGTGMGPGEPKFRAAMNDCRRLLPNGGEPTVSPADAAKALQFARCMRAHGIDMPDPGSNGAVHLDKGRTSLDVKSEKFQAAQQACQKYAPRRGGQQTTGGGQG